MHPGNEFAAGEAAAMVEQARDDVAETPEQVATRYGLPIEWARMHVGRHVCVDGRRYIVSCLVTDPTCEHIARRRLGMSTA